MPRFFEEMAKALVRQKKFAKIKKIPRLKRWKICVGDKVEILSGKERGKQGIIKKRFYDLNKVTVEGCYLTKRHIAASETESGKIVLQEKLIDVSNVNLIDPSNGYKTRVKLKLIDGIRERVSMNTGTIIPYPEKREYKVKEKKINKNTDTTMEDAYEQTYIPPDYNNTIKVPGPLAKLDETKNNHQRPAKYSQAFQDYRHIIDYQLTSTQK